jgi:hypothetical protein
VPYDVLLIALSSRDKACDVYHRLGGYRRDD